MPRDTIQKALKGNSSAMLSLYEESKAKTMSLCLMLLQSEKDADEAMVEVYTYTFRELVAGRTTSEAEFEPAPRPFKIQCRQYRSHSVL